MLKIQTHNDTYDYEDVQMSKPQAESLFSGESALRVHSDLSFEIVDVDVDDDTLETVKAVKWAFATNDFERYVQDWMNDQEFGYILDLLHGGIQSGITELMWNTTARERLAEHFEDVAYAIQDVIDNMGASEFFAIFEERHEFSFEIFIVIAFEETVRKAVESVIEL